MLRLYKKQKLCSALAIDALFDKDADTCSCLAYPLRAVWRENPGRKCDAPLQFVISVPKKRLRHAVDRVTMRRRIREAFRLHHQSHPIEAGKKLDVIFVYVNSGLLPYGKVERAMQKILTQLSAKPCSES